MDIKGQKCHHAKVDETCQKISGFPKHQPLFKLKALRIRHQLVPADISKELGISEEVYAMKENGVESIMLNEAMIIAEIFGESLEVIF